MKISENKEECVMREINKKLDEKGKRGRKDPARCLVRPLVSTANGVE